MAHACTHAHTSMWTRRCDNAMELRDKHRQREREVTANRRDGIIEKGKVYTDKYGDAWGKKCHSKRSTKEAKVQEFRYRDTKNMGHEMSWSHR